MKSRNVKQNRKKWFQGFKGFLRIFFRRRKYVFLGDIPQEGSVIFSNHVGASAPFFHELYAPFKMRFWGTYEMTGTVKDNYRYLSTTYLHQKKGINKTLAKILAFIICPFTKLFYDGMNLIPTYTDARLIETIRQTNQSLDSGESLIIFPEDSHDGYHRHLTKYHPGGFYVMDKYYQRTGKDIMVYNCYYVKKLRTYFVDKGISFSSLLERFGQRYSHMAKLFCDRANELGETYSK